MDDQVFPAVAPADEPLAPPQLMTPPPQRPAPAQALQLVTLAETVELFHSPGGEAYATVPVNDHWETCACDHEGSVHGSPTNTSSARGGFRAPRWCRGRWGF